jgi:hypothetical protein
MASEFGCAGLGILPCGFTFTLDFMVGVILGIYWEFTWDIRV